MAMLTAFLFFIFGQYRDRFDERIFGGLHRRVATQDGDTVRVAGIRVGTVNGVSLQPDRKVVVKFDADRNIVLTTGTRAAVRYLNLVGDRYLELVDGPGIDEDPAGRLADSGRPHRAGTRPRPAARRTETRYPGPESAGRQRAHLVADPGLPGPGRNPRVAVLEDDRRSRTRWPTTTRSCEQLIDNLNIVVGTLSKDGDQFSGAIDRLEQLVSGLSNDRDPIGDGHRRPSTTEPPRWPIC